MTASPTSPPLAALLNEGIAAMRRGDKPRAYDLLVQALQQDAKSELGWLWLSAAATTPAQQRYCLERVLDLNPEHAAVREALRTFAPDVVAEVPFGLAPASTLCATPGCSKAVSKPGHTLCYEHWKAARVPPTPTKAAKATPAPARGEATPPLLAASALAERMGLSAQRVNLIFAELGWIEKARNGWRPSRQGQALGAIGRTHTQSHVPFVVWPEAILAHTALRAAIQASEGESTAPVPSEAGFRERFPAQHRTTDGHWVRSKAEVLIDNWLYMAGIVHAYERWLPIEEEAYCDFYLPTGKVYIEYWGLEQDPGYAARRQAKQALYHRFRYRTENMFACPGARSGSAGKRKPTGTRKPSRRAYRIARTPIWNRLRSQRSLR